MSGVTKSKKINFSGSFFQFFKAIFIALIITFLSIIIFALVIKATNLQDNLITPINLGIKALSVIIGTIIWTKDKTGGLKKGLLFAVIYTTLSFLTFSMLSKSFNLGVNLLLDYVFLVFVGMIVGIIRVNTKK